MTKVPGAPLFTPPKPEPKPAMVKILNTNTIASPTDMGGMSLLILGLGDNGVIYSYDGSTKIWSEQR